MARLRLTEDQFNELLRLSTYYHGLAKKCMKAKAYLPACIMAGSALEAAVPAMCECCYDEILQTSLPIDRKHKTKPLLHWTLHECLKVARGCGWLPSGLARGESWRNEKAKTGDYAIVVKELRNLVHPSCYLDDLPRGRLTKGRAKLVFRVMSDVANLFHDRLVMRADLRR